MSDNNLSTHVETFIADDAVTRPSTPSETNQRQALEAAPQRLSKDQTQHQHQFHSGSDEMSTIGLTNMSVPFDTQGWSDDFLANMGPVMIEMQPTPPMALVTVNGNGQPSAADMGTNLSHGLPLDSPFDYPTSGMDMSGLESAGMINYAALPPQFQTDPTGGVSMFQQSQLLVPPAQPVYQSYGNGVGYTTTQPQPQAQQLLNGGSVPNSQGGSPSTSSSNSLERSGSFSEMRQQLRPKRKLTTEDKRTICEKYNAAQGRLRQEDLAQDYGVDRSTISKILAQEARWSKSADDNDDSAAIPSPAKLIRSEKLRFPQIEDRMHQYFDSLLMHGQEVRDQDAREHAKFISREYGLDQFKCSTKWWESFKTRRLKNCRALPISGFKYGHVTAYELSHAGAALSRSQSVRSDISSLAMEPINLPSSAPAITPSMSMGNLTQNMTPTRQRSQSSPQVPWDQHQVAHHQMQQLSPALSPSSGKAPRTIFASVPLGRQKSYNGSSTTPTRPSTLSRTYSVQGSSRPSPHKGLGASAFGLVQPLTSSPLSTPLMTARSGDKTITTNTPTAANPTSSTPSSVGAPIIPQASGQMQQALQRPLGSGQQLQQSFIDPQRGYSTISPNMSESGESTGTTPAFGLPPMTPITPATVHGSATFPNTDYGEMMNTNEFVAAQAQTQPQVPFHSQQNQLQPPGSQPIQHSVSQPLMGHPSQGHLMSHPLHATGSDHPLAAPFVNLRLDSQPAGVGQHYLVSPQSMATAEGKPLHHHHHHHPIYNPVDQSYYQSQPEPQPTWYY